MADPQLLHLIKTQLQEDLPGLSDTESSKGQNRNPSGSQQTEPYINDIGQLVKP